MTRSPVIETTCKLAATESKHLYRPFNMNFLRLFDGVVLGVLLRLLLRDTKEFVHLLE